MTKKVRIAVVFGGRSAEHEVSLRSARTIVSALDSQKYDVVLIGIDRQGHWLLDSSSKVLLNATQISDAAAQSNTAMQLLTSGNMLEKSTADQDRNIDVLFPVLHGPYGEDGTIQGLAKLLNLPCVGAGVIGSAVGMDKDVMKRLLKEAGIPITKSITVRSSERDLLQYTTVIAELGSTVFIKPANMGSSVGVSKASTKEEFDLAVDEAFKYDRKIIIESEIVGREIECSVLGNDHPQASLPGEIIANDSFYSYDSKYSTDSKSQVNIPADLSADQTATIQSLAIATYKTLECRGMARVDFFLTADGKCFVNEINTIPGFTSISMYPKMWEATGLPLPKLIDRLIELAIEDFQQQAGLLTQPA